MQGRRGGPAGRRRPRGHVVTGTITGVCAATISSAIVLHCCAFAIHNPAWHYCAFTIHKGGGVHGGAEHLGAGVVVDESRELAVLDSTVAVAVHHVQQLQHLLVCQGHKPPHDVCELLRRERADRDAAAEAVRVPAAA